jgi:Uri superfamily endonuclease
MTYEIVLNIDNKPEERVESLGGKFKIGFYFYTSSKFLLKLTAILGLC